MSIIVESSRDERVLLWLIDQFGESAVEEACSKLAGSRRAYVSNVAKLLGVAPPAELALASKEDALRHLKAIRRILKSSKCI